MIHDLAEGLVCLLNLSLFLQPRPGSALPADKARSHAAHPLDSRPVVLQHFVMLVREQVIALDLKSSAGHGHVLSIQHNIRIGPSDLLA